MTSYFDSDKIIIISFVECFNIAKRWDILDIYYKGNLQLDYSVLNKIQPYSGDTKEYFDKVNIDEEISKLSKEMQAINTHSIEFDKYDYFVVFASAVVEIFVDFMVCDYTNPNSIAEKLNHNNNALGKWCNNIHENLDHTGNPLDFQGQFDSNGNIILGKNHSGDTISFGGGNHRERTYGHDLMRFLDAIKMYHDGSFVDSGIVNINGSSKLIEVFTKVNQNGNPYKPMSYFQASISYAIHMVADFFSSKGLPLPGWSWLSHAEDRDIRTAAADAYNKGLNFRTLLLQGIPIAICEIIIRLYIYLRYRESGYEKVTINHKRDILLLMAHSMALAMNLGKVVITSNPFLVNIFMIIRVCGLIWNVIRNEADLTQRSIEKINLSMLSLQFRTTKTLLLLDESIYYTNNIKILTMDLRKSFDEKNKSRIESSKENLNDIELLMKRFREINNK